MRFKEFYSMKLMLVLLAWALMINCKAEKENNSAAYRQRFESFKKKYGKRYNDYPEQRYREIIASDNFQKIQEINKAAVKRYTVKSNKFSDLTAEQFKRTYGSLYVSNKVAQELSKLQAVKEKLEQQDCFCKRQKMEKKKELEIQISEKKKDLEKKLAEEKRKKDFMEDYNENIREDFKKNIKGQEEIQNNQDSSDNEKLRQKIDTFFQNQKNDFLKENLKHEQDIIRIQRRALQDTSYNCDWSQYTGGVRVQGECGACYAFAAVQNVQALYSMFTFGFPLEFSVQQIIDCSNNSLSFGCDGGFLEGPFSYLLNHGVTTEYQYPYVSGNDPETVFQCKQPTGPFKIASYDNIQQGNCTAVKQSLIKRPVSVGIASYRLQFYSSGTFTDCDSLLDHAVLLVGYNAQKGWKIKNTWGTDWGEEGYAWIDQTNNCGICEAAISPNLPNQQSVIPALSLSQSKIKQALAGLTMLYMRNS